MRLIEEPANQSLWAHTAHEALPAVPLSNAVTADLTIVGGGFTGCSAALQAAEQGLVVRLIEARDFAHGGSGRNVGLVNAGLWLPPETIEQELGAAAGRRLNEALAAAPDLVFDLIERHAIACDALRNGTLHCAHGPGGLVDLKRRHQQLLRQGAPVTLLTAQEAQERIGSDLFPGALHDARAGTINPYSYCMGLARAATTAGAVLHNHSPATAIRRDGDHWVVEAGHGQVRSSSLLLATNAYHDLAKGVAQPKAATVFYFQLATEPLSSNLRGTVLPGGEGCWDTATVMSSFRTDASGRVLIGGMGSLDHASTFAHDSWAKRKLARLFPQLGDQPIEFAWSGRVAMTADHLPKIVRLGPGGYQVHGYSGRGIGPGTVFGKAIGDAIAKGDEAELPLSPQAAYIERFVGAKTLYYETGAAAFHLMDSR